MKLLDKLKNALFEEEYVEVEEKEKKSRKEKEKKDKKVIIAETNKTETYEESKPIAKRIIPIHKSDSLEDSNTEEMELSSIEEKPKIAMIEDEDLVSQNTYPTLPPVSEVTRKRTETVNYDDVIEEEYLEPEKEVEVLQPEVNVVPEERPVKLYQASKKESYLDNYTPHEYGNYEKQREKEVFKPSPIISPVYGIVEDTRFMDKPKREIRITTSISHEKINIDDIRRKAYGSLSDDIDESLGLHQDTTEPEEVVEETKENVLLDLNDENNTPEVNNLTVGDAVEYFEDLGLEYNEDYIDADKTSRVAKHQEKEEQEETIEEEIEDVALDNTLDNTVEEELPSFLKKADDIEEEESNDVVVKDIDNNTTSDSDNLFDLIDSMYE